MESGLLLLSGDSQPSNPDSEYFLAEEILDIASRFSTGQIFTLAGIHYGFICTYPRIFGTAGDLDADKASMNNTSILWKVGV